MDSNRRIFLKGLSGAVLLSLADVSQLLAGQETGSGARAPLNFIIPRDYLPPSETADKNYRQALTRAALEVLQANFSNQPMPVWGKTLREVDLEKRIYHIIYWILRAVRECQHIYPLDPAWIAAQIMKESYFHEFAISRALAVGICQVIQPTAQEHGILCAGTRPEHRQPPYRLPEAGGKADEYYQLRRERGEYRRGNRPAKEFTLEETLQILAAGDRADYRREAGEYLAYLNRLKQFDEQINQARDEFRAYLLANVEGRDIFADPDLNFILNFDERFSYKKPVYTMVRMLAGGLKSRNGNILAATAGYNAGLYRTADEGMYKPYGKIPSLDETATYVSHVLINHYEITLKLESIASQP